MFCARLGEVGLGFTAVAAFLVPLAVVAGFVVFGLPLAEGAGLARCYGCEGWVVGYRPCFGYRRQVVPA